MDILFYKVYIFSRDLIFYCVFVTHPENVVVPFSVTKAVSPLFQKTNDSSSFA